MSELRPFRKIGCNALVGLVGSFFLLLNGCTVPPSTGPTATHVVLIWLKHPKRSADRAQLIRAAHSLRMIPGVLRVQTGRSVPPIGPHPRRDFDLGVVFQVSREVESRVVVIDLVGADDQVR